MPEFMQMLQTKMNVLHFHPSTILPFFFISIFIYKFFFKKHSATKKHLPPTPTKLPIIGNMHQIGQLPHRSLQKLSNKYGDVMLLYFGKNPVLVVSSAETASGILKTHDLVFADRPDLRTFKKLLYDCKDIVGASYGEYWRRVRSICVDQLLTVKRVQSFFNVRKEEIDLMVSDIERLSHHHNNGNSNNAAAAAEVNLSKLFMKLSSDIICRAAFGLKFYGERGGIDFKDLLEKHQELLGGRSVGDFIPWLGWINHVNGNEMEMNKTSKNMDKLLEDIVQEHMGKYGRNQGKNNGGEETQDFIDVLLELQQDKTSDMSVNNESIKAIILDMFTAGSTTTFTVLEWAMSELLTNPKVMETLKREVRGITRGKTSITDDDLDKMVYLNAVIKETFRLHPPVPLLLPRISSQDTKLNGFDIPTRTEVMINVWAIQRDPRFWKDPLVFSPERFLNANAAVDYNGQNFNLLPFGSGRRGCPGMLFGIANIELALAHLVQKFDWALPEGNQGLDYMAEYPGLTIHRKYALVAVATPCSVV